MQIQTHLKKIEELIQGARPEEQRELLAKLPKLLKLSKTDLEFLKLAEKAFDFWNSPEDQVYDYL